MVLEGWTKHDWEVNFDAWGFVDVFGAFDLKEPYEGWVKKPVRVKITIQEID